MPGQGPQTYNHGRDGARTFRVEKLEKDIEQFDEWQRSMLRYMRVDEHVGIQPANYLMIPTTVDPRGGGNMDADAKETFNKKLTIGLATLEKYMTQDVQELLEASGHWDTLNNNPDKQTDGCSCK